MQTSERAAVVKSGVLTAHGRREAEESAHITGFIMGPLRVDEPRL